MANFKEHVYKTIEAIPYGTVASYGQIALMVGVPRAAIQVGWVLNRAAGKYELPWWRIINNAGRISIKGCIHTPLDQKRLLEKEGIIVNDDLTLDIEKYRYRPTQSELKKLKLADDYIQTIIVKYLI